MASLYPAWLGDGGDDEEGGDATEAGDRVELVPSQAACHTGRRVRLARADNKIRPPPA